MSHCVSCDSLMSQKDMRRKSLVTGEYINMCGECFVTIKDQVKTNDNDPLIDGEELEAWDAQEVGE